MKLKKWASRLKFVSHTVSELKQLPCPDQFKAILPYYLIKYDCTKVPSDNGQFTFMDKSTLDD